ncbi:MAG: CapA family protein [Firmicutes bacterium]|nr:CapA family protein [Bacillota bacterium]
MKKPGLVIMVALALAGCLGWLILAQFQSGVADGNVYEDFSAFQAEKMKLPPGGEPVLLVAVGDIMLSRGVAEEMEKGGGHGHPFEMVRSYLREGDVVFGNLEGPITDGRKIKITEMKFRADPGVEQVLKDTGFNLLSLANNHTPDFGSRGLLDTMQYLDRAGIRHAGAGASESQAYAPAYMEVKGMRLALLAFNDPAVVPGSYRAGENRPGTAFLDPAKMRQAISKARKKADFVVVSIHAGTEYVAQPHRAQVRYARLAVDAGADLVLGHHPHVVQKVERYRGKYIIYSLGNFVFDQFWSRATRQGVVAGIYINANGVEKMEFLPVFINDRAQPRELKGEEAETVLAKLELPLETMDTTVWDREKLAYVKSKRYVFHVPENSFDFRLVKSRHLDLDRNGVPEHYTLRDGGLEVRAGSRILWRSPDRWWVDDFFLGDANNDGMPELNLLVWREGSFGPSKPFWVTEEDTRVGNHLFLFQLADGAFKPVWQSSRLDRPNYGAHLRDLDGDGENELVATEGCYTDPGKRQVTVWKWNGWGFTRAGDS